MPNAITIKQLITLKHESKVTV